MQTLYRIVARTIEGEFYPQDQVFDRATVAGRVKALNERSIGKGLEYRAEAVDLASLSSWQLAALFQTGKLTYEELEQWAGQTVAEQALASKCTPVRNMTKATMRWR